MIQKHSALVITNKTVRGPLSIEHTRKVVMTVPLALSSTMLSEAPSLSDKEDGNIDSIICFLFLSASISSCNSSTRWRCNTCNCSHNTDGSSSDVVLVWIVVSSSPLLILVMNAVEEVRPVFELIADLNNSIRLEGVSTRLQDREYRYYSQLVANAVVFFSFYCCSINKQI